MLSSKLHSSIGNTDRLYVDDVFSTYLYTGNGSTQTINNGIDLAGKGGLVWTKKRNSATQGDHLLVDTVRGTSPALISNSTAAQANYGVLSAFNSSGYTLTSDPFINGSGNTYVSWTFRKAPKFFDVVTWTGDDNPGRVISHALGIRPGMIIAKNTINYENWIVKHTSMLDTNYLKLNLTDTENGSTIMRWGYTSTGFDVTGMNVYGRTYVAYLFAHDTSADGVIQCGSYIGNGSETGPTVTLGWEPQYLMIKNASGTGNWQIIDSMRGMSVGSADATLQANSTNTESSVNYINPTATGFQITSTNSEMNTSGSTYIYLAIRRPNKPPTTGTQVYNAIARTGTGGAATVTGVGFAPDLVFSTGRNTASVPTDFVDRMRGPKASISPSSANAEFAYDSVSGPSAFSMDGVDVTPDASFSRWNWGAYTYINHFFKRAVGVFDQVCYTGVGIPTSFSHNMMTPPELIITKCREPEGTVPGNASNPNSWNVWHTSFGVNPSGFGQQLMLHNNMAKNQFGLNVSALTSSSMTLGNDALTAGAGCTLGKQFVAYLFATKAGISKVGSYTGNGSSQTINCGFTTGARFILIKRTDSTGDWYVWDTARGIVSANDPHLSLHTAEAEVTTDDSVDPEASGFIVNQVAATNVNVTGATYIFLAVS